MIAEGLAQGVWQYNEMKRRDEDERKPQLERVDILAADSADALKEGDRIGGAIGAEIAASVLAGHLLSSGEPSKHGYTLTFCICVAVLVVGVLASLAVPGRSRGSGQPPELDRAVATDSRKAA